MVSILYGLSIMIFHKEVFIDNVNDWVVGFFGDELLLTEYKGVETI